MVKVIWTDQAILDLDSIGEYIAKDSSKYASLTVERLFHSTDILETQPKLGRIVPEFNDETIRELIFKSYRIVYKIIDNYRIDILTIHHSARKLTDNP